MLNFFSFFVFYNIAKVKKNGWGGGGRTKSLKQRRDSEIKNSIENFWGREKERKRGHESAPSKKMPPPSTALFSPIVAPEIVALVEEMCPI